MINLAEKFVDALVKDPARGTRDACLITEELEQVASDMGLMLSFKKATKTPDTGMIPIGLPVQKLNVLITQDGVPVDQPDMWRVENIIADPV